MSDPATLHPSPRTALLQRLGRIGRTFEPAGMTYAWTRFAILRSLGLIYTVAFLSLWHQLIPLFGTDGILPADLFINRLTENLGGSWGAFRQIPSLFLFVHSEPLMAALCIVGLVLAIALLTGFANLPMLFALWAIYLSFVNIGQRFYSFGWESLLLEATFLAFFMVQLLDPRPFPRRCAPPLVIIWAYRWLVFRVMFGAGLIKLRGDSCWWELTCLHYHYETQPIPNPLSYWLHHMPSWFHRFGVFWNHVIEIPVPFLVLGTPLMRRIGGLLLIQFQVILILSGNLSWLNWLTIGCCLACFDDRFWGTFVSRRHRLRFRALARTGRVSTARKVAVGLFALLLVWLSQHPVRNMISENQAMNRSFEPFRILNTYGAFGHIGKVRNEIILEGTYDDPADPQARWFAFQFKAKPGDVQRPPPVIAPYHYRIDWVAWFAAMSDYRHHPWLVNMIRHLLEGNPETEALLAFNPFQHGPPRAIRADLYEYRFAPPDDPDGAWWVRRRVRPWLPPLTRDHPSMLRFLAAHGLLREKATDARGVE